MTVVEILSAAILGYTFLVRGVKLNKTFPLFAIRAAVYRRRLSCIRSRPRERVRYRGESKEKKKEKMKEKRPMPLRSKFSARLDTERLQLTTSAHCVILRAIYIDLDSIC